MRQRTASPAKGTACASRLQCELTADVLLRLLRTGALHAEQLHCLNGTSRTVLKRCVLASIDHRHRGSRAGKDILAPDC